MASLLDIFKRKRTFDDLTLDELTMAKAKLQHEQDKIMRRVTDLEKEKDKLFQQGVNAPSQRHRLLIAQQIQDVEAQSKAYDQNLAAFSKQTRVLNGVIFLKQNRKSWEDTPLGKLMGGMNMEELGAYVDQATAENSFQMDKFQQLLGLMEGPDKPEQELDEGLQGILEQMERARAATFGGASFDTAGESPAKEAGSTTF
jgi:hypothetical protein